MMKDAPEEDSPMLFRHRSDIELQEAKAALEQEISFRGERSHAKLARKKHNMGDFVEVKKGGCPSFGSWRRSEGWKQ